LLSWLPTGAVPCEHENRHNYEAEELGKGALVERPPRLFL